jgi:predicted nucleotidyltransferase
MTMRTTKPRLTKAQILGALKKNEELTSDIDFIVEFERPTYDNFYGLCVALEKLFKRKVEVLTPDAVDSIRVDEVARSIRESVVYSKRGAIPTLRFDE